MTNPVATFFDKIVHLFQKAAPKLADVLQPEIDLLNGLLLKFAALDLTTATTTVLSAVAAGTPPAHAIAAGAVALKAVAVQQSVAITDQEAGMIAQALFEHATSNLKAAATAAPAAAVEAPATESAATP